MSNVVGVKFRNSCGSAYNSRQYHYYTTMPLAVGEYAVVDVNGDLQIVQVTEVNVCTSQATKYIVDRIDLTVYNNQQEKLKRTAELKKKLVARSKKLGEMALYITLAKEDAEMAALLYEYNLLNK